MNELKRIRKEEIELYHAGNKYSIEYMELLEKEREILTKLNKKIPSRILIFFSEPGDKYYDKKCEQEREYNNRLEERRPKTRYELEMTTEESRRILEHNKSGRLLKEGEF
jgi:hypothetical protein